MCSTLSRDQPATCRNCKRAHPASSPEYEFYKNIVEDRAWRASLKVKFIDAPAPTMNA